MDCLDFVLCCHSSWGVNSGRSRVGGELLVDKLRGFLGFSMTQGANPQGGFPAGNPSSGGGNPMQNGYLGGAGRPGGQMLVSG